MTDVAEIARGLTKAQREAVMNCRRRTRPSGDVWDFMLLRASTRNALVKAGVATPWGMVSASLSETGLAVRDYLKEQQG